MITIKVNMDLVDPKRYFKGAKGSYLDLVLIETPGGQYGDYMVKQSVTKEERLARVQMPILGNAKIIGGAPRPAPAPRKEETETKTVYNEDVPF